MRPNNFYGGLKKYIFQTPVGLVKCNKKAGSSATRGNVSVSNTIAA